MCEFGKIEVYLFKVLPIMPWDEILWNYCGCIDVLLMIYLTGMSCLLFPSL